MTMLPGYPILLGAFFVCLGIFYSFQNAREANDVIYSVLLPVKKTDIVKSKYLFVVILEGAAFALASALTALRMTALSGASPYLTNALMNASPFYLAIVLLIFAAFNTLFLGLHFRTGWKIGPVTMVIYAIVTLAGWLLGGQIGIGTVLSVAYMGPALQTICKLTRFDAAEVKHQNLLESLRILAGREPS